MKIRKQADGGYSGLSLMENCKGCLRSLSRRLDLNHVNYVSRREDDTRLFFASSRVVITGSPDLDTAERTFETLRDEVTDFLIMD